MTQGKVALCGLLLGLSGCTISATSQNQDQGQNNACDSDANCGNANCIDGVCQTDNGQLESLLVEVTPTSDSALAHVPFIVHLEDLPTSGGEQNISLLRAARVTGRLSPGTGYICEPTFFGFDSESGTWPVPTDGSMPVNVTLTPRDGLLGLPAQVYLAKADGVTAKGEYKYDLQVPSGVYDVYVVPPKVQQGCLVPPQLFRGESITPDTTLSYLVAEPSKLPLIVQFPESSGVLDGWVADIIEPVTGHSISTAGVLGDAILVGNPSAAGKLLEYDVPLAYNLVHEVGSPEKVIEGASDLVRLRPPPEVVAPTILVDRAGLGLFSDGGKDRVLLNRFTQFPDAVVVEGQMARRDDGKPASGHVSLVSSEIFGVPSGIFALYQSEVDVDEAGVFSVALPPGRYRVYAVPPLTDNSDELGLSALEVTWEIPADVAFQAGKLLELPTLVEVTGQTSLQGAQVQVVASAQSVLPFDQAFGAASFVPRATTGLVDQAGRFVVAADPGTFDISIRAPESSSFAWFVRPGIKVEADSPEQDLGRLLLPPPSVVTGRATVGETTPVPVTSALIRAYAYLDDHLAYTRDLNQATSVIQVAETRTDDTGAFKLLVPSSIAAPK